VDEVSLLSADEGRTKATLPTTDKKYGSHVHLVFCNPVHAASPNPKNDLIPPETRFTAQPRLCMCMCEGQRDDMPARVKPR